MLHAALSVFTLAAAVVSAKSADLVRRNGKITTMNAAAPVVQAIVVRGIGSPPRGNDTEIGPRPR
jgi:hypothetical protein